MLIIERRGEVNQRTIAREVEQNESAIAATLTRLVQGGFVRKKRSKSDGRALM